jgi:hypothetical protein
VKRANSQQKQQYNNFPVEEATSSVTIADHNLSEQLSKQQPRKDIITRRLVQKTSIFAR